MRLQNAKLSAIIAALILIFNYSSQAQTEDYSILFKSGAYTPEAGRNISARSEGPSGAYVMIQFYSLPGDKEISILRAKDNELFDYIPKNAYYAYINYKSYDDLANIAQIRAIFDIPLNAKSDTSFQAGNFPEWAKKEAGKVDIVVRYFENVSYLEAEEMVKIPGVEILGHSAIFHTITLRIETKNINLLASKPAVIWMEPVSAPPKAYNFTGRPLHRSNVLLSTLHGQRGLTGRGVNASICDEGDISAHIDLRARLHHLYNVFALHSTHCSGTIAGGGLRDPYGEGMAPQAQLYSWAFNGSVMDTLDKYFLKYNLVLNSNSWGYSSGHGTYDGSSYNVDQECRTRQTLTQVWAAGNAGPSYSTVIAGYNSAKNIIVVGALYQDSITVFSSIGPVSDGRIKPEVCALGGSVYSTSHNNGYTLMSGTSMATPGTTGSIALLYQRYHQLNKGKDPHSSLIKAVLCNSAFDMGNPGPDYQYGFGRIDELMAVRELENKTYLEDSVKTGDTIIKTITIPKNLAQIKLTVNWDDYPGANAASREQVNNIDFRLVANSKTTYLPWRLNSGSPSSKATRGLDSINNVKQITVDTLRAGTYKAMVIGKYIPKGPQRFALAWEIDTNSLEVTHPMGGESFSPQRAFNNDTNVNYYGAPHSGDTSFIDTNQINIAWEANGTKSDFNIYFSGDSGSTWKKIGTAPSYHRNFVWTIPDTVTSAGMIKITSGTYTSKSDSTFTILQTPQILSTKACASQVQLVWSHSRRATSYQIMRLSGDTSWKVLATLPDTTFLDTTVAANTKYWYTVRALYHNSISPRFMATEVATIGSGCFASVDAGISAIDSPYFAFCKSAQNIYAHLNNYGAKTLTSVTINWSINGTAQTAYKWTGSLANNTSVSVKLGSATFASGSTYDVKAWTSSPNGTTDQIHANDTFNQPNIQQALSGTYTIGGSGANYSSFNAAITALAGGICGPVVFNVNDGNYTEQVTIKYIPGVSATNTVTFQSKSGDSTKVNLNQPAINSTSFSAILSLDSAQWVTFKQITIQLTGNSSYNGCVVEMDNNANNNTITNCRLVGIPGATYSANQFLVYSYNTLDTGNVFSNNVMKYGSGYTWGGLYGAAIFWYGQTTGSYNGANVFKNNLIDSFYGYYHVIYVDNQDRFVFSGNTVSNFAGTYPNNELRFYACTNSRFTKNKILIASGFSNTLLIYSCSGSSSGSPTIVANNFISVGGNSNSPVGIYSYYNSYVNFYFNNINITNTSTSSYGLYEYGLNASSVNNIENNCVVNKGGGVAGYIYYYDVNVMDYNNWYVPSTSTYLGYWQNSSTTTSCSSLSAWKTASGMDSHALSIDPQYVSATDLHVKNKSLIGAGTKIAGIPDDIDGQTRASTPCIGADEIFKSKADAGISSIDSPANSICAGKADIAVTIKDYSASTLTSATINWTIDGVSQSAYSWTGSLTSNKKASGIILGSYTFSSGSHTIKAWTSSPNGLPDSNTANDSSTIKITVNVLPTAKAGSNQAICSGNSTTIGATSVAGHTYNWLSNPSGFSSTSSNPSVNPTTTTTYTLTETITATGCKNSNSVVITINPLPNATSVASQGICNGSSISIGAAAVGGDTYSWSSNPSGYSSTSSNPKVSPTATTTYYLTETIKSTGCYKTDSVVITVNPLPTVNAGTASTVCGSASASIGSTAVTGNSYSWTSKPSGFISSSSGPTVSPTTTTTYYLTVTINSTGCSNTDSVIITVKSSPLANAGKSQSICTGSPATIGSKAVSGDTYSWTSNPSGFTSTSSSATPSPTITTTYYLTEKVTATGCSKSDSVVITVNPLPVSNAGSNATICSGSSTTIGSSPVSGNTYSWSSNPSGFTSSLSNPSVSPTNSTTYYLITTITATGCYSSDSVVISTNPLPKANAGTNAAICLNSTASIGATAVSGDTYSWTSNPSGYTSTSANATVNPTVTTTYYLTETSTATSCKNTDSVIITINPLPAVKTGGNISLCQNSSATIGSSPVSGYTYAWTSKPSGFTSNAANPTISPISNTTYYLTVTNSATKCTNSDSAVITINSLPFANAGANQSTCAGSPVTIGSTAVTGNSYSWRSKPAGYSDTLSNPTVAPLQATTYYLTEKTNATGCSKTDSVKITVNYLPVPKPGNNQTVCAGKTVTLGAAPQSGRTYQWSSNPSGFSDTSSQPKVSLIATTTYYLTEKIVTTGCTKTDSVIISVNPLPAAFTGGNKAVCAGMMVTIGGTSVNGDTYSWTSQPGGFSSSVSNTTVKALVTTTYYLTEQITNTGCSRSDSAVITANALPNTKAGASQTVCAGNSVNLGIAAVSGHSYSWSSTPSGFSDTMANPTVNPTTATTYFITEKIISTGCSKSDSVVIKTNPLPKANAGSNQSVCQNVIAKLGDSAIKGDSYSWTSNPAGFTSTLSSTTVSPAQSTTYYLTETITATGCSKKDSAIVTIYPLDNASFTDTGSLAVRFYPNDTSLASYSWDFGDGNSSVLKRPFHNFTAGHIYLVKLTVTDKNGCTNYDTIRLNRLVIGMPSNDISVADIKIEPNPFKNGVEIEYNLPKNAMVLAAIFDATGRQITVLQNGMQEEGKHSLYFDAEHYNISAGIYFLRMAIDGNPVNMKMVKVK